MHVGNKFANFSRNLRERERERERGLNTKWEGVLVLKRD